MGLGAAFNVFNISNPVSLTPREANPFALPIERRRRAPKQRRRNTFKGVDADDCVKTILDATGDDGHDAAPRADVEVGSLRSRKRTLIRAMHL